MAEAESDAPDGARAIPAAATLVYDGACPFCTRFAAMVRLRAAVGAVELVDARRGGPVIERLRAKGIDLDQGNVFSYGGRDYVGPEAMQAIATLTGLGGALGRLVAWMIRTPGRARRLYPLLRGLRNLMLRLKGEPQLRDMPEAADGA
jgi:predicted DCC family thiol-disulfide oxidoreductase YuxK